MSHKNSIIVLIIIVILIVCTPSYFIFRNNKLNHTDTIIIKNNIITCDYVNMFPTNKISVIKNEYLKNNTFYLMLQNISDDSCVYYSVSIKAYNKYKNIIGYCFSEPLNKGVLPHERCILSFIGYNLDSNINSYSVDIICKFNAHDTTHVKNVNKHVYKKVNITHVEDKQNSEKLKSETQLNNANKKFNGI